MASSESRRFAIIDGVPADRARARWNAAIAVAIALVAIALVVWVRSRHPVEGRLIVRPPDEVELRAVVHSDPFDSGWMMPGYHALVWRGGRAAHAALLRTDVSDRQVLAALQSLNARPGNNVPMEAWEERKNPRSAAPDTVITGPRVAVLLRLPGRQELFPLSEVLEDPGGRGLDLRFGGHHANIPRWKSGCIVCLYSCPGSKIGNARYTERDYARGVTRFRSRTGILPKDGTAVGVVLRLLRD
jgi:hypothetical protein